MKLIQIFVLVLLTTNLYGQYAPKAKGELIKHSHYQFDYNESHEQPNWVYYVLTSKGTDGSAERKNNFRNDSKVSTSSASTNDYKGSGYDRGHLCPAADMRNSQTAMNESFYMSNMSPQHPSFNRGIWKACEELVRNSLVDTLYIVTGPIFKDNKGTIGPNEVTIPGYYYKVMYDKRKSKMVAYVIPNEKTAKPLSSFITTVDSIESLIGVDLFHQLPDNIENELERAISN